ncbi:MAG: glutamine amidotransferase [Nocardia sp.]|uniref:glutamine amidotransferase n=1 Tax=Nocardia sp. TaxID=1821 RepID=UPI00262BED43|nr:glutamine amidotransferase [Nocardia sp.]MCU1648642.1 glutamine amidotransferase [Nocardia sp.]
MCGIVGLHLLDPALYPQLGTLLTGMLDQMCDRGPDSAGMAVYGDPVWSPPGTVTVTLLDSPLPAAELAEKLTAAMGMPITAIDLNPTILLHAEVASLQSAAPSPRQSAAPSSLQDTAPSSLQSVAPSSLQDATGPSSRRAFWPGSTPAQQNASAMQAGTSGGEAEALVQAVRAVAPSARVIGFGPGLAVLKGIGNPTTLANGFGLPQAQGWQGVAHTRMATESAVTAEGSHPFSVGPGQCLVHNGSFSNHMSIKHELQRAGVEFDSENDTEVGARFVAQQLAQGADLEKALLLLNDVFDGFYTLLVSTSDSFAVVRDAIACKPAIIAETDRWVAMASEYRALADLPGVEQARIFEPEPEEVYVWRRS